MRAILRPLFLIAGLVSLATWPGGVLAGGEPVQPATGLAVVSVDADAFLYPEARAAYHRTVVLQEMALVEKVEVFGPHHPDVAARLNDLAGIHHGWGDYGKAEFMYKRALRIAEKTLDPGHPSMIIILRNYSLLLVDAGRAAEASEVNARADRRGPTQLHDDGYEMPISYY